MSSGESHMARRDVKGMSSTMTMSGAPWIAGWFGGAPCISGGAAWVPCPAGSGACAAVTLLQVSEERGDSGDTGPNDYRALVMKPGGVASPLDLTADPGSSGVASTL